MTVGSLRRILEQLDDSREVILYAGESGQEPMRGWKVKTTCVECEGRGLTWRPRSDGGDVQCIHCKGSGIRPHVILSDVEL